MEFQNPGMLEVFIIVVIIFGVVDMEDDCIIHNGHQVGTHPVTASKQSVMTHKLLDKNNSENYIQKCCKTTYQIKSQP